MLSCEDWVPHLLVPVWGEVHIDKGHSDGRHVREKGRRGERTKLTCPSCVLSGALPSIARN